jgi:hypothetical protein
MGECKVQAGPNKSPSEWSPDDRAAVKNFFKGYNSKPTVDAKLTFILARSSNDYKGRGLWRNFITSHWKKWKVQSVILTALKAQSVLYTQVMVANELDEVPENIHLSHLDMGTLEGDLHWINPGLDLWILDWILAHLVHFGSCPVHWFAGFWPE